MGITMDEETVDGEEWYWDEKLAHHASGAEAQAAANRDLMEWTGAETPHEAAGMLVGRPGLSESGREKGETLRFKAPASMAAFVRGKANSGEYLRGLVARDMREHGRRV